MNKIATAIFAPKPSKYELDLIGLAIRVVFLLVFFMFFWNSAFTKFEGFLHLTPAAYVENFPRTFESVNYNVAAMPLWSTIIVYMGAISEMVLPMLIVIGLLTRLAGLGMVVFVVIMTIVDVYGHDVEVGAWLDSDPYGLISDSRLIWLLIFLILSVIGGGYLSFDKLIAQKISKISSN